MNKELIIAEEIRSLIADDIFGLLKRVMLRAECSEDPDFDVESFKTECGLCYIHIHKVLLSDNLYKRFPDLNTSLKKTCLLYTSPSPRDRG